MYGRTSVTNFSKIFKSIWTKIHQNLAKLVQITKILEKILKTTLAPDRGRRERRVGDFLLLRKLADPNAHGNSGKANAAFLGLRFYKGCPNAADNRHTCRED